MEKEMVKEKKFFNNGKVFFVGEYLDGKIWNGKGYHIKGYNVFEIKEGKGNVIIYYPNGDLEYYEHGEYLDGKRWNGKLITSGSRDNIIEEEYEDGINISK